MAPPSATTSENGTNGSLPSTVAPLEPGLSEAAARGQMAKFPGPPTFTDKYEEREYLKGRLAAAFRIFGKYGFDEGVAGHITLRDPVDTTTFWVNPFGVAFSLMKRSDLIQVDHHGEIIGGGKVRLLNTAAFMIHGAVHEARSDVMCAAHSHSIYGRSFCALGRKLDIITQDACSFHDVRLTLSFYLPEVLITSTGPRPLLDIQRHRPRRKGRQRDCPLLGKQKGRSSPEPRPLDRRRNH